MIGLLAVLVTACSISPSRRPSVGFDPERVLIATDGRRYRIERMPKTPGGYIWTGTDTVRYYPFAIYIVDAQDADFLYVRQYLAVPATTRQPAAASDVIDTPVLAESREFEPRDFGVGLPRTGQRRGHFAIADMDGDGRLDLVLAPARKTLGLPIVLLGDGAGNWQPWADLRFPPLGYDYGSVAIADFNGDRIPDIALAMHLRGLAVLVGDGKGGFVTHGEGLPLGLPGGATPLRWSSQQLAALDWNGDGRSDLVAIDENLAGGAAATPSTQAGIRVFLGGGDVWREATLDGLESMLPIGALTAVAGVVPPRFLALPRNAGPRARALESAGGRWHAQALDALPADALLQTVTAADLDGRNGTDLVVSYQFSRDGRWFNAIDVLHGSRGNFRRQALYRAEAHEPIAALALGHFGRARRWDLAVIDADGKLLLFAGDDHGFFRRDRVIAADPWRQGCSASAMQALDLDGDGNDELVAAFAGESSALSLQRRCVSGGGLQAWTFGPSAPTRR